MISTTNLRESYQGSNKNRNRDEHKIKLEEELKKWKDATIIRVLVRTEGNYNQTKTLTTHLASDKKTSSNELLFLCGEKYAKDLFGETFARLAELRMAGKSGEAEFEERIKDKKRGRDQEDTETDRKRPKN